VSFNNVKVNGFATSDTTTVPLGNATDGATDDGVDTGSDTGTDGTTGADTGTDGTTGIDTGSDDGSVDGVADGGSDGETSGTVGGTTDAGDATGADGVTGGVDTGGLDTGSDGSTTSGSGGNELAPGECRDERLVLAPVDDVSDVNGVFQDNTSLRVDFNNSRALMKFDLRPVPIPTTTELQFTTSNDTGSGTLAFYLGSHNEWPSDTPDTMNVPSSDVVLGATAGPWSSGERYSTSLNSSLFPQADRATVVVEILAGGAEVLLNASEGDAALSPRLLLQGEAGFCASYEQNLEALTGGETSGGDTSADSGTATAGDGGASDGGADDGGDGTADGGQEEPVDNRTSLGAAGLLSMLLLIMVGSSRYSRRRA